MKNKTTLYVSDLDGTLINSSYMISHYSIDTLNDLIARGLNFTYATARSYHSSCRFTRELKLTWPVIVYNGAMIVKGTDGAILDVQVFCQKTSRMIEAALAKYRINPLVYTMIDTKEKVLWHWRRQNDHVKDYIASRRGDLRFVARNDDESIYEGSIFYYTAIDDLSALEAVYGYLKTLPGIICSLKKELYTDEYFLEIMAPGANKAKALERLKKIREYDELVCFGDETNDLEMLKKADVAVAVKNAAAKVKQVASSHAGSNDEDGVARWIAANFHDYIDN